MVFATPSFTGFPINIPARPASVKRPSWTDGPGEDLLTWIEGTVG